MPTVNESADHVGRLLESSRVAVVSFDGHLRIRYANRAAEQLLRMERSDLLGRTQWELFPGTEGTELETTYRTALASGHPARFQQYYPEHDTWYEMDVTPAADGLDVALADVTWRKRVEADRDEAAQRSGDAVRGVALLTEVTEALTSTLNQVDGVRRLARLVVPDLADWCIVSLADPETGTLHDLAVAHRDPDRQTAAEEYARARGGVLTPESPVRIALATARSAVVGDGDLPSVEHVVQTVLHESPARDLLRALSPGMLAAFPLTARGRVNGILTLYWDAGTRVVERSELLLADEVAARAGMALDNARLYEERRSVALRLQEALLTALPEPDHLELRARYLPAAMGERVGGDWYDAIVAPSGTTGVVVGDVAGHDIGAAAVMGQVRTVLRTLAWEHTGPPGAVLRLLDRALDGLGSDVVATCLYATIEQTPDEKARMLRRLHWSSAGHPPPVLVHPDGRVEVLDAPNDLILGVVPDTVRTDHERDLPAGSTVVLYTDGLIERRRETLTEGLRRLTDALAHHAALPLEAMLDAVLLDVVGGGHHGDDIAVLAVRMHPEDRPRPPEAGPRTGPSGIIGG